MARSQWQLPLLTSGTYVTYTLDTGAMCNVLPQNVYNLLEKRPKLHKTKVKLSSYGGESISVVGKVIARIQKGQNKSYPVQFIVVSAKANPIIGLKTCEQLNLIKHVSMINNVDSTIFDDFDDLFGDLGCLPGTYHINIDPNVKPVVQPPRQVPFALRHKLRAELDRMVSLGVIEKVDQPTDWVNSIVLTEKHNGDLRICLDPKDLNRAIKREFVQMPTAEEIMSMMSDAKFFSKIDASAGYWQIKLDEDSANLLAFNTPFGRYRFMRMPFGIHSASEVFSKRISEIIEGLDGVAHIQDDIIIWAPDKKTHDERFRIVLDQIKKSGLKLNKKKCVFGINELKFCGHIFSDQGVKADPDKISAITDMPLLEDATELRRFLRMITYLAKFVKNLSSKSSLLRKLLEKDTPWEWTDEHTKQFRDLQLLVTDSPVLKYFDQNLPTKVSVDASKAGLGAVLLQLHRDDWHSLAYASRAMSKSKRNYLQTEKETLAVVYGSDRFNQYVYGRRYIIESDHKPLQSILQRNIDKAPPRIQRLLPRLQRYDIDLTFTPGRDIPVPDTLSRAYLPNSDIKDESLEYQVHLLINNLPVSQPKLKEIQDATSKDPILQKLQRFILDGFPNSKSSLPPELMPYFQFLSELSIA